MEATMQAWMCIEILRRNNINDYNSNNMYHSAFKLLLLQ